jgi:MFS family permease
MERDASASLSQPRRRGGIPAGRRGDAVSINQPSRPRPEPVQAKSAQGYVKRHMAPEKKWGVAHYRVLGTLYFAYFSSIFSRTAVQISLAAMAADPTVNFTPAMTATVLSSGAGMQTASKLLGVSVISKLGPHLAYVFSMCLMFSSITLMTTPIFGTFNFPRFVAGWMGNMWAAATMWPCLTSISGEAFKDNGFSSAVGILSTSSRIGAILGNLVWGPLSAKLNWVNLIRAGSLFPLVSIFALKYLIMPLPAAASSSSDQMATSSGPPAAEQPATSDAAAAEPKVPFGTAMKIFAKNPRLWMVYFTQTMMTLLLETQALLPVYLRQGAGMSAAAAGAMAAVYPFGAAGATVLGGAIFDRFTGMKRAAVFGIEHVVALGGLGMLAAAPAAPTSFALLLIMAGSAPTFYLISAEYINRYAGPDYSGTLMSWLDVPGQFANIIFMGAYPGLVQRGGWSLVFRTLQGTTLCGSAACLAYLVWDAYDPTTIFTKKLGARAKKASD